MNPNGGCLCGGARYELQEQPFGVVDCHCLDCRRSSGAPYVTWGIVHREKFKLLTGTLRRVPYAGRVRAFAACCGTQILFEDTPDWPTVDVAIATLDDPKPFPPTKAIWVEDKLPWVALDPAIPASQTTPAHSSELGSKVSTPAP
jgi:hypothetical protein